MKQKKIKFAFIQSFYLLLIFSRPVYKQSFMMMTRSKTKKKLKNKDFQSKILDITWIMFKKPIENFKNMDKYYDYSETRQIPKNINGLKIGTNTMLITFDNLNNDSLIIAKESIDDMIETYESQIDSYKDKKLQNMVKTWHSYAVMYINEQYYFYTFEKI